MEQLKTDKNNMIIIVVIVMILLIIGISLAALRYSSGKPTIPNAAQTTDMNSEDDVKTPTTATQTEEGIENNVSSGTENTAIPLSAEDKELKDVNDAFNSIDKDNLDASSKDLEY